MLILEQSTRTHSPKMILQHAAPVSSYSSHEEQGLHRDEDRKEDGRITLL